MSNLTEIIDRYLNGSMSPEELKSFEERLQKESSLKREVDLQRRVLSGIQQAGIRSELKKGFNKASLKSKFVKWATGIIITTLAITTVIILKDKISNHHEKENIRYELNEEGKSQWSDADKFLKPQIFKLKSNQDTVIETNGGIILSIPKGIFVSASGQSPDEVELEIKEALSPLEIMKAGLSTTSDGKLLETGGMFYINARNNKENLKINPEKGIYANIPDINPGKNMMLFEGQRMPDGTINWINPKPFEKKLVPVDIMTLNFYPPNFLDSLSALGFDITNKLLMDSIYYSFTCSDNDGGHKYKLNTSEYEAASDSINWTNVNWKFSSRKIESDLYELSFRAEIKKGFHIFSIEELGKSGPMPTKILFKPNSNIEVVGGLKESQPNIIFDNVFNKNIKYFKDYAIFTQRVKIIKPTRLNFEIEYMVANEEIAQFPPAVKSYFDFSQNSTDGERLFKSNCSPCHNLGFQKLTGPGLAGIIDRVPKPAMAWLKAYILNNEKMIRSGDPYANKIYNENGKAAMTVFEGQLNDKDVEAIINYMVYGLSKTDVEHVENVGQSQCEIEPYRIHSFWDKKFNNTLLATKEFEERMQVIFRTCNYSILELYTKNMNKQMWEIDKIAATMCNAELSHKFEEFARRKDGGVSINEDHMRKLQKYMDEKQTVYKRVVNETIKKMYEAENVKDLKALEEFNRHNNEEFKRMNENFNQELTINMKEAYRQLGKEYQPIPARNFLGTTITSTGWKNVDAYVLESTVTRSTLDYTDPENGKKAVINYKTVMVKIADMKNYDRVVAYLIPDKLNSFQKMNFDGNVFKENLNELINYGLVVFGFIGEEVYCSRVENVKPEEINLSLNKLSPKDLDAYRNFNSASKVDLVSEFNYQIFQQKDYIRRKTNAKREEIKRRLWNVVFPCAPNPQPAVQYSETEFNYQ